MTSVRINADDGGEVDIETGDDNALCRLIVPANAIVTDTTITAELTDSRSDDTCYLEFSFEPEGLNFLIPAELHIDTSLFNDPELTCVDWFYLDPGTGNWLLQGRYAPRDGIVKIKIDHFSTYRGISQGGQVIDENLK